MFLLREWHSAKLKYLPSTLKAEPLFASPFMSPLLCWSHRLSVAPCPLDPPRYSGEPQRKIHLHAGSQHKMEVPLDPHSELKNPPLNVA